jgi:adenylate kinase family enzyme
MEKIAIIGPPGAGKTTLTKKLSSSLKTKAFHLDRFFWQCNWEKETKDNRIDILQQLIQEKQWIIEGTYIHSTDLHLVSADTIIFLDIPSLVCLLRLIKRQHKDHGRPRRDIPEGCIDKLTWYRILKVLTFRSRDRKTLQQKLPDFETKKTVIRLRSKKEVEVFLANPELFASECRQSIKKESVLAVLEWAFNIIFDSFVQVLYTSSLILLTPIRIFQTFASKAWVLITHMLSPVYNHNSRGR